MRAFSRYLLNACLALGVCAQFVSAADRLEEFDQARRNLLLLLRSREAVDRIEGVKRLEKFPIEESVRLIHASLEDSQPEVRQVAYQTLTGMNDNFEVCETLLGLANKAVHAKGGPAGAATPLSILMKSKLRSTQSDVEELLVEIGSSKNGAVLLVALVDDVAQRRDPGDVALLERLSKTPIFDAHFGLRRAIVHALTQIRGNESLGLLISILDRAGGEARADAVEHLAQVTGQIFGMESDAWQKWWTTAKDTFVFPENPTMAAYRSTVTESSSGYYYGMPMFAERLVFVLDTSGSMNGQRIMAAKRELIQAIQGLPDYAHFGIVVFNSGVNVWQQKLVPANEKFKRAAITFVSVQGAASMTASYDALDAAFVFDTEAIYFLSDGAPTSGKIVAPVDIVAAVTAANKVRRISVYTIGIGAGFPGSPLDVFLKTLAEKNNGVYRRVDN